MKITIDYEASWRNSFLDGSNNEAVPKKGRNFIASMTELKKEQNYIPRDITLDTVLGVLNRLIGDQRKLYQSKQELGNEPHYFSNMTHAIKFEDKPQVQNQETTYIRNMKGSTDQNSFTGMIKVNDPIFQSDYSSQFWGVLSLEIEKLYDFILQDIPVDSDIKLNPITILNRLEAIKKIKPVEYEGKAKAAAEQLALHFDKFKPRNAKNQLLVLPLYCSALYFQLNRLEKHFDISTAKSKMGGISGISNNGFTPKDFMDKYTTGNKKLIYGNPYVREEFVKGEGKIKHTLTKASGQLHIQLDIDLEKSVELKNLIDCAGVSSFYLGKKGLAYVSRIDVR